MTAEDDTKMDGKSLDITKENIAALKELFPEVVEEGKIDFGKLKVILGEEVDDDDERYNFTWHGKNQAIRMSQTSSMGTLRPCKEESVDWDTTQNLYIEGDNLEVLKLLQKSYFGKVKMIYIDPPYNTGKDFVYPDNYSDNITNYKQITNQIDNLGNDVSSNSETAGKYHTNWLNMMYPRLKLARNLLSDDGLIFISINDSESVNLIKMCNEIFGENNFICNLIRKGIGGRQDSKYYAITHEYCLIYSKNNDTFVAGKKIKEDESEKYTNYDEKKQLYYKTQLLRKWGDNSRRSDRPNLFYPIKDPDGNDHYPMASVTEEGCWRWSKETMSEAIKNGDVEFRKKDGQWVAYEKIYNDPKIIQNKLFTSIMDEIDNSTGAPLLKKMFGGQVFDYPKPVDMVKQLMQMSGCRDEIVLDFFSGSATTAHAVMDLNHEDGVNRKYICVQLPSRVDINIDNMDFKTICDIGKERIRRAGRSIGKIQSQTKIDGQINNVDVGFKVFKLDSSNVKLWNPIGGVKQTLLDHENNILSDSGRTDLDIIYEIMLKMGLELTSKIDVICNSDATLYSISSGALMICLDDVEDTSVAEKMISVYKEQKPFVWKVVFKDNGFASDDVKANTRETLKMAGLPEGSFVTL